MSMQRILAIVLIFLIACGGWTILGTTTDSRSSRSNRELAGQVESLWGGALVQVAPSHRSPPARPG